MLPFWSMHTRSKLLEVCGHRLVKTNDGNFSKSALRDRNWTCRRARQPARPGATECGHLGVARAAVLRCAAGDAAARMR